MTVIKLIRGHPVANIDFLVEEYKLSRLTITRRINEMVDSERYKNIKRLVQIMNGRIVGVNYLAFYDFMSYYDDLKEPNLAKDLPIFDPAEVATEIGWYKDEEAV